MFGIISRPYNYSQFTRDQMTREILRRAFDRAPKPGERAPDFTARNLTGDSIRLSDCHGCKNVVLAFGSATDPMTAGSIGGMNDLFDRYRDDDVEFLFVYVREAHPGDGIPAHESMADKVRAAEILQEQENIEMPILVDDLRGTIHRKYGSLPNPAFLIDKSGRIAFRSQWAQSGAIEEALRQLLKIQHDRGLDHAVVLGGEDRSVPVSYPVLYSYRALQRGGRQAILDFETAMGFPGKMMVASSRIAGPVVENMMENPGKIVATVALGAGVVAAAIYAGRALRRRRVASRNPYDRYVFETPKAEERGTTDYPAVGI
ncbi:MAG TPA: deiodinase-like protein [Terriglobales bacterium]|jgi:peroxiredoxin|nr:deiodinase-like protein [Terriglobales bacterium]